MSVEAMKAVWDHSESRGGPRLVLLALSNRADEHGIAWPGLDELQRKAAMSRRAVQNALRSLEAAGELTVVANVAGGRGKAPLRWISLPDLDGDLKGAEQRLGKGAVTDEKGRSSLPEKGADIDAPYIENSQKEPSKNRQAALSVFDHWLEVFSKNGNTRMDSARHARIRARLKSFSVADLKRAIEGASADEWITGKHPASPGYGLVTILRDDDQVERFMALAERKKPRPRSVRA